MHFYFAVIYWDIFPSHRHAKDLFFSIKHSHLRCWRWFLWRNIFFFAKFILFIVLNWIWLGFTSTNLWEVSHLFTGVAFFLLSAGQGLLECGLPPHLVNMLLLLAVIFSFGFRKVFLKLNPTSSFTVKGLLPDEQLAKAIAWLLNCKFSVISVTGIAGVALIPSSSLCFASRSLKPEIKISLPTSLRGWPWFSVFRSHNSVLLL